MSEADEPFDPLAEPLEDEPPPVSRWRRHRALVAAVVIALATRLLYDSGWWADAYEDLVYELSDQRPWGWSSWRLRKGSRRATLLILALAPLLTPLRFGRVLPALVALLPWLLGGALFAAAVHGLGLIEPRNTRALWLAPVALGALLALAHGLQLLAWHLQARAQRAPSQRAAPLLSVLAVVLVFGVGKANAIDIPLSRLLITYAMLTLPALLLLPLGARLLRVHPGINGTPDLRHAWWALRVLWVMGLGGLSFLLRNARASGERRQTEAIAAIKRITARIFHGRAGGLPVVSGNVDALKSPGIVVANHVSMFDILAILSLPSVPTVIFVKRWVLKAPVLGHMARAAGYIDAESLSVDETFERAQAAIDAGRSVLVFPEGSRTVDGNDVKRFRNGAFALARKLGVPVTPIALVGTVNVVRAGTWWVGDHDVQVCVLDPLDPADYEGELADKRMANAARDAVREAFWRLWPETQRVERWHRPLAGMYRYLGATVGHYAASKFERDPLLKELPDLCPGSGTVLHAGCGLGLASARLAVFDPRRAIRGVDLDPRKVELASAALGETTGARFEVGDLRTVDLAPPEGSQGYEVVLLIDVLHYWSGEVQDELLARLHGALAPGGALIFRDGVAGEGGHGWVAAGERLATLLGFTRAGDRLAFESADALRERLERAGFAVRSRHPELGLGSNLVLVCEKAP